MFDSLFNQGQTDSSGPMDTAKPIQNTTENILVRSGLAFQVEKRDHYNKTVTRTGDEFTPSALSSGIFRTDTGAEIGDVGKDYTIAQTDEILEPFLHAANEGFLSFRSGRTINNGQRFCLTFNTDEITLRGEKYENRVIIGSSHDGSWATFIKCMVWRQVCSNGLIGLRTDVQFRVRHTESWKSRYNDVLIQLEKTRGIFAQAFENYNRLFEIRLTQQNRALLTAKLLEIDPAKPKETSTRKLNQYDRIMYLSEYGKGIRGNAGILNTGAAWYNAVTEYVTHESNKADEESRFVSANFGAGENRMEKAYELVSSMA